MPNPTPMAVLLVVSGGERRAPRPARIHNAVSSASGTSCSGSGGGLGSRG